LVFPQGLDLLQCLGDERFRCGLGFVGLRLVVLAHALGFLFCFFELLIQQCLSIRKSRLGFVSYAKGLRLIVLAKPLSFCLGRNRTLFQALVVDCGEDEKADADEGNNQGSDRHRIDWCLVRGCRTHRRELGDFGFEFFAHTADDPEEVFGRWLFRARALDLSRGERRDWREGSGLARGFEIATVKKTLHGVGWIKTLKFEACEGTAGHKGRQNRLLDGPTFADLSRIRRCGDQECIDREQGEHFARDSEHATADVVLVEFVKSSFGHRLYGKLASGRKGFDLGWDGLHAIDLEDAFQEVFIMDCKVEGRAKLGYLCQWAEIHKRLAVCLGLASEDPARQVSKLLPLGFVASVRRQ
jgi:hypothetical protein